MRKNNTSIEIFSLIKKTYYLCSIILLLCTTDIVITHELHAKEQCDSLYERTQNLSLEIKNHEMPLGTILSQIGCQPRAYYWGIPDTRITHITLYFRLNDTLDIELILRLKKSYNDIPFFTDALNLETLSAELISSLEYEVVPSLSEDIIQHNNDIKVLSTLFVQHPEVLDALQRMCTNFPLCMVNTKREQSKKGEKSTKGEKSKQ